MLFGYACSDAVGPTNEPARATFGANARVSAELPDLHPYERNQRAIAQRIPSFAGLVFDPIAGMAIGYATRMADSALVASAVATESADQRAVAVARGGRGTVIVRPAVHSFTDLTRWRDSILLWTGRRSAGIRRLDVIEDINAIEIGVERDKPGAHAAIRNAMREFGVPAAAVSIVEAEDATLTRGRKGKGLAARTLVSIGATLLEESRPLLAGTLGWTTEGCTMGLLIRFDGFDYATMASHCTPAQFAVTNPSYLTQGNGVIGYEAYDPPVTTFWHGGAWRTARWSEVSLYRLYEPLGPGFGRIAKPVNAAGSLSIDQNDPYITLTGEETGGIANGWLVAKVGIAAGWRYGNVVHSCYDVFPADIQQDLYCQFDASFTTEHGDSGGPVFAPYNGGWIAVGSMWGKTTHFHWWPPVGWQVHGSFSGFRGMETDIVGYANSGRFFAR
jgi:hypothetical protein